MEKLKLSAATGTPAERRIAKYFSEHLADLPLETAASIADRLDLSPMTVGRFLRSLGYQGLDGIYFGQKTPSVGSAWQISERTDILHKDLQEGRLLAELMSEQIDALHKIYAMTSQEPWRRAEQAILGAREIFIASYQNVSGIARYFAEQLSYARDNVRYMDGQNGTYLELLGHDPANTLLIVIACRRFASKARMLTRTAQKAGHRVLLITDQHCDWGREEVQMALTLPAIRSRTWDTAMALAALLDFLVTAIAVAGGESTNHRTRRIGELQDLFGDFARR